MEETYIEQYTNEMRKELEGAKVGSRRGGTSSASNRRQAAEALAFLFGVPIVVGDEYLMARQPPERQEEWIEWPPPSNMHMYHIRDSVCRQIQRETDQRRREVQEHKMEF